MQKLNRNPSGSTSKHATPQAAHAKPHRLKYRVLHWKAASADEANVTVQFNLPTIMSPALKARLLASLRTFLPAAGAEQCLRGAEKAQIVLLELLAAAPAMG